MAERARGRNCRKFATNGKHSVYTINETSSCVHYLTCAEQLLPALRPPVLSLCAVLPTICPECSQQGGASQMPVCSLELCRTASPPAVRALQSLSLVGSALLPGLLYYYLYLLV
jgi:hypothetical protein